MLEAWSSLKSIKNLLLKALDWFLKKINSFSIKTKIFLLEEFWKNRWKESLKRNKVRLRNSNLSSNSIFSSIHLPINNNTISKSKILNKFNKMLIFLNHHQKTTLKNSETWLNLTNVNKLSWIVLFFKISIENYSFHSYKNKLMNSNNSLMNLIN